MSVPRRHPTREGVLATPDTRGKRRRRFAIVMALVLATVSAATYWLFYDGGPAPSGRFRLDLAAVRAEAARIAGPLATRVEVETVAEQDAPRIAMVSGTSWSTARFATTSYRVVYPDHSVMIDTGYDSGWAAKLGAQRFDDAARKRILRAMDVARVILVTHEHVDHVGGALTSPRLAAIVPKLMLTSEQMSGPEMPPWPRDAPKPRALSYHALLAVAPGAVLIKAAGHTAGSQMLFLRLANGREYLFTGDLASMIDNVRLLRQRSRYVTSFRSHDDRAAVAAQLGAVRAASAASPGLILVPGHDADEIDRLVRAGRLSRRFRF